MLSFDNTQVAFSSKSDTDLNRSYWLFKMVGNPKFVDFGKSMTDFALKINFPIKWAIKPTIFKQFCGGESIEECNETIQALAKFHIGTILDYSIEGKEEESDFDATMRETIATIERAKGDKNIPFSVFKVTGLARFDLLNKVNENASLSDAEKAEFERVKNRVDAICKRGHELGVPVFIDAEESWIQDTIDMLADEMMEKYNKQKPLIYNTFQLYRHDRLDFLKSSLLKAKEKGFYLGAKLVRGAYMEKERERASQNGYPSPINPTKEATDEMYNNALKFCVENIDRIAICAGSHNEKSAMYLADLMLLREVPKNHPHIYFSQLLGMSDHISYNLSHEGYNVAKYVPYGPVKEVIPYLIRRAQENTSVEGQTGRELNLIMKEKQRRQKK